MTDPYQQGGPQYGPQGTGPDMGKAPGAPAYPSSPAYPAQPQQYPSQPDAHYGAVPGYGQPAPGYGQPPAGYGQPPADYGQPPAGPGGYNPMDPEAPYGRDMYGVPLSDKQKLVAGLLQIFLGGFGVGRFYLGHTGMAVGQIAVTIFTCGIGGSIWGIIDGILILTGKVTDPLGRPLRD